MRELELAYSDGASWMGTTAGQWSRSRVRVPSQITTSHAKRTENFTCYACDVNEVLRQPFLQTRDRRKLNMRSLETCQG